MSRPADPFDELRDHLERAAGMLAPDPSTATDFGRLKSRRWRPSRRIGALAVAAALVTGTAVAATAPWHPRLGGDYGIRPPTRALGGVPATQKAALGVLRRPQTDADRGPAVQKALRRLGSSLGAGVRVGGIRLLRDHGDRIILLVPLRRVGPNEGPRDATIRDGLCVFTAYAEGAAAGSAAPRAPSGPALPTAISGASCGTLDDVKRGRVGSTTAGLVPDGVARVRVVLTTGKVLTANVTDNYYELPIDVSPRAGDPTTSPAAEKRFRSINGRPTTWLDARGHTVRKTDR